MTYSRFMNGMKKAGIELDRKFSPMRCVSRKRLRHWSTNSGRLGRLALFGLGDATDNLAMENPEQLKDALLADVAAAGDLDR